MIASTRAVHSDRATARNVFMLSNTDIVGSNPVQGIDSVVSSCVNSGLVIGLFAVQGVIPAVCKIRSFRLILKWEKPEGLIRRRRRRFARN